MRTAFRFLCLALCWMSVVGMAFGKSSSSVTVASSSNPSTYGNSVTLTATVTPSAATGTVTFKDGTTTLGTGTLSGGKTTYSTSALAAGSHSITAAYGGDSNYNSSTSSTLTQTVNKANTTTTVASSANPSTFGASVTFTATVTPSAAAGTVTFKDGSTTLGTGTLSSGKATYSVSTLAVGSHSITAAYGGSSNYNSSTSSVFTQTVNKAGTTTTVASSANPSTFGSSLTFTATITPSAATGTVTFKDGSTTLGTGTLSAGKATYSTSTLSAGSHSITAAYAGDSNYNSSTSSTLTQTVNKANTTTTVSSSSNPSAYGSSVTFTATVTPSSATGTVTFKDGSTTLGTGTVSGGTATYSTSALAVGSHSIKATYGGDSNDNTSTSATLTQAVLQASSVALTSSANPSPYGAVLTFIATVTPSAATGTVTFYDGITALGSGTISGGIATYATSTLTVGSHSITAVYGGSSTYASSTSATLVQSVLSITSIAVTPASLSLSIGATQQLVATATYSDGSHGNINSSAAWSSSDATVATVSTAGVATGVAEGAATIQAAVGSVIGSASITGTPSKFRFTGSLNTPRTSFTATTLQNGQVLIVGGNGGNGPFGFTGVSELYNPLTGTFTLTGSLNIPRAWHTATLLQNGQVLITGGTSGGGPDGTTMSQPIAELYDPTTGAFSYTGSLNIGRADHAAALLQNGQVLITGGWTSSGSVPTATAELYDPTTGSFTYTGSLITPLWFHSATLLNDGTVLIAGGDNVSGQSPVASAELFSPSTGTFTATGNLNEPRENHTATLLSTGKVLIATGTNTQGYLPTTEIYDPVAKTFSVSGSLAHARGAATATGLNSGQVLVVGGVDSGNNDLSPAELYDPTAGTFSIAGNLNIGRDFHSAALLNDGTVLIVGGEDQYYYEWGWFLEYTPQAEIYQSAGQPQPPAALQITPASANVTVGGTQHFNAIDSNGYPRQDVVWTVGDPSLATVTADENDAAVVTGIAPGQVTLTANAENTTGQAQVTISPSGVLSSGTIVWSSPPMAGFSLQQIVQTAPTGNVVSTEGLPDLYSTQLSSDGSHSIVQALTADGRQLWQATLPALNNNAVTDGAGGLIVTQYDTCTPGQTIPLTVMGIDPVYGQPTFQVQAAGVWVGNHQVFCYGNGYDAPQIAVRGDGAVIISEPTNNGFPPLTLLQAGGESSYSIPPSSNTTNGNTIYPQCCMGPPMFNTDGTAYVEYEVRNVVNNVITSDTLYLFHVARDNSWGSTVLSSTTQNQALLPGPIVPDGQGGILATWTISPSNPPVPQYPYQVVDVVSGVVGTPYNLPFSPQTIKWGQSPTIVLGENGIAFATDGTNTINGPQIISFTAVSGSVTWSYQVPSEYSLSLISSASGGGLAAKVTDQSGNDTVIRFSSAGTVTTDSWSGTQVDYYIGTLWTGGSPGSSVIAYSAAPVQLSSSPWFEPSGAGAKGAVPTISVTNFVKTGPNQTAILNTYQKILAALPSYPTCNNWLQGTGDEQGVSGSTYIQSLITNTLFGHGVFDADHIRTAAISFSGGTTGIPAGTIVTVNDNGAFFNATASNGQAFTVGKRDYAGGSLAAQAEILIHELGHDLYVAGFQHDNGIPKAGKANDSLVDQNCRSLIEGIQ